MKQNKLILFDWGGVVESMTEEYSNPTAWNETFKELGYTGTNFYQYIENYPITTVKTIKELETEVYNKMKEDFQLKGTFNDFLKIYEKNFAKIKYYKDIVSLEHELGKFCKIGIISNLLPIDKERLNKQLDLSKYDYLFLSYEMGLEKPNMKIYEEITKITKLDPHNILLVDDKEKNIKVAEKIGWKGCIATGKEYDKIKENCKSFINN